jgi:hypothetical protein
MKCLHLTSSILAAFMVNMGCSDRKSPEERSTTQVPKQQNSLEIDISLDKDEYTVGSPIKMTIVYKNNGSEKITLYANGCASLWAFAGETFTVSKGNERTGYTFFGIDPMICSQLLEPGASWTRTIPDLKKQLTSGGQQINGEFPSGDEPEPLSIKGRYTIGLKYEADWKNIKDVYQGSAESNAVTLTLK